MHDGRGTCRNRWSRSRRDLITGPEPRDSIPPRAGDLVVSDQILSGCVHVDPVENSLLAVPVAGRPQCAGKRKVLSVNCAATAELFPLPTAPQRVTSAPCNTIKKNVWCRRLVKHADTAVAACRSGLRLEAGACVIMSPTDLDEPSCQDTEEKGCTWCADVSSPQAESMVGGIRPCMSFKLNKQDTDRDNLCGKEATTFLGTSVVFPDKSATIEIINDISNGRDLQRADGQRRKDRSSATREFHRAAESSPMHAHEEIACGSDGAQPGSSTRVLGSRGVQMTTIFQKMNSGVAPETLKLVVDPDVADEAPGGNRVGNCSVGGTSLVSHGSMHELDPSEGGVNACRLYSKSSVSAGATLFRVDSSGHREKRSRSATPILTDSAGSVLQKASADVQRHPNHVSVNNTELSLCPGQPDVEARQVKPHAMQPQELTRTPSTGEHTEDKLERRVAKGRSQSQRALPRSDSDDTKQVMQHRPIIAPAKPVDDDITNHAAAEAALVLARVSKEGVWQQTWHMDRSLQELRFRRVVKCLGLARTSSFPTLLTVLVGGSDDSNRLKKHLEWQLRDAATWTEASRGSRNREALIAVLHRLQGKPYKMKIPPNGLAMFSGSVMSGVGREVKVCITFEPPKPLKTWMVRFEECFNVGPLEAMLDESGRFGFIVVDGSGALFGVVQGSSQEVVGRFSVSLPKKHGRGGSSAPRFARIRLEKRQIYVRKVAEVARQYFVRDERPSISGLFLAGSADIKTELMRSDALDQRLSSLLIKVIDVAYGGECGFHAAISEASDALKSLRIVSEKRLVTRFLTMLARDSENCCIGVDDTIRALELGAVETILVWDGLKVWRLCTQSPHTGEERITYGRAEDTRTGELVCHQSGAKVDIVDTISLVDWLIEQHRGFGAKLEFLTDGSREVHQFCRAFSGLGGLLRYKVCSDLAKTCVAYDDIDSDFA